MRARILAALFCACTVFLLKPATYARALDYPQPPVLTCSTLIECLAHLQKPYPCAPGCLSGAYLYAFIDDQGGYFSLLEQFEKFDRPAVSALIRLLDHPDWTMRARSGMVLADLSTVEIADLPAILKESRKGNEWIAPALARIGTPEAITQLINVVKKSPFLDKPHGVALKSLGSKVVPFVLQALACETDRDCSLFFVRAMGELGASPDFQSREIQDRLVELAASENYSRYIRVGALQGLKEWQPYEDSPRLHIRPLIETASKEIRTAAVETLASWSDASALPPLLEAIESADRDERYRLIALLENMGPVAMPAGPRLVPKLHDDDWNLRHRVAAALGKIAYLPATTELISSVAPADWKLTYAAMISLTRFESTEGETAIREIAHNYWHPAIRLAAQAVADGKMAQTSPTETYCASKGSEPATLAAHPDLVNAIKAGNTITVTGGKLVAVDGGEWGGALEFWPETGLPFDLTKADNVMAVFRLEQGIFAVTTPRGESDDGFLYRVGQDASGRWSARKIWRLPGAPEAVIYTPGGVFGIATNSGDVIFRPVRGMEWISCPVRE